ncbi:Y-family DNA polymerase [Hymenobacter qilianensis]|uniref:Y-family DNA polymerase n=1 Tax=Hymenobacter qilianensis TaxID=1385715 RepID=UPI001CB9C98C|nr:hypothetical protein [Hymenobacter qilianensis]
MFALVDCNNFYVSCERAFQGKLRSVPVVVLSNNDGCIISRSQEAKALGIRMGEPYFKVKPLLEQHGVRVFSSNYALYGDMSRRVMYYLSSVVPDIELYSIDEAFLDLRGMERYCGNLVDYAANIKQEVYRRTHIPTCIGIGPTKTLAKLANRITKKNPELGAFFASIPQKNASGPWSRLPWKMCGALGSSMLLKCTRPASRPRPRWPGAPSRGCVST